MRIGSLEVLTAMAVFASMGLRMRTPPRLPSGPVRVQLEVQHQSRSRELAGVLPFVIGRSADTDLLILDPEVSRRHAILEAENGAVFLTDLQSRNGTYLNGRRIRESIEVRPGDHVDVGTARILFQGSGPWT